LEGGDMGREQSIVGDLINFRGLVYSPINENGVVYLFGKVTEDLHMYVEEIKPGFPDCIARRFTGKGWERTRVEFEFKSSNFKFHGHNPDGCDLVVCWEHDWKECPIEVIELRSVISDMDNVPIKRPGTTVHEMEAEKTMEALFDRAGTQETPRKWWESILSALHDHDDEIWLNIGMKYVGLYSPEKSFASLKPSKTALAFECFTRGEHMEGVQISNKKFSPRWGKFTVKNEAGIHTAIKALIDSQSRLKTALKTGEQTSYFSGGVGYSKQSIEDATV
jgi:hypothetical protein